MFKSRNVRRMALAVGACAILASVLAVVSSGSAAAPPFQIDVITGGPGAVSGVAPEAAYGAQAAAAAINKKGGLGGRKIVISTCSNMATTSAEVQCASQAVQNNVDDAVTIGGNPIMTPILQQAGIPQFGSEINQPYDYKAKLLWAPVSGSAENFVGAAYYFAKKYPNLKRWAGMMQDSDATTVNANLVKQVLKRLGGGRQWVGQVNFPPTTDLSPQVQQLKGLNPDVVIGLMSLGTTNAYVAAATSLGLNAKTIETTFVLGDTDLANFPDQGSSFLLGSSTPPVGTSNLPAIKDYRAQLKAAGITDPVAYKARGLMAWLGLWEMKALADTIKGSVTKQTLIHAAQTSKKKFKMFGLFTWCPACKGPPAYPNSTNPLVYGVKVVNGKTTLDSPAPVNAWKVLGLEK